MDRQGILDNLTAIETTAKLLVNAFATKSSSRPDLDLSLNGVHRQELVAQTTTFLTQAQNLIVDLSNSFNLSTDTSLFQSESTGDRHRRSTSFLIQNHRTTNEQRLKNRQHPHRMPPRTVKITGEIRSSARSFSPCSSSTELKAHPPKKSYPLSSVTLDDIVQNRLSVKQLFPHYPLLRDAAQPNLIALARSVRPIDNLDDVMLKIYAKIFNQEERLCCSYDGNQNKLPYPPTKRLLADLMLRLVLDERQKTVEDNERRTLYLQCEKHSLTDTPLDQYRGLNIEHCDENLSEVNEKQLIGALVRRLVSSDDIKRIVAAKQDQTSQWNTNEICIYYARPLHLLWIKQKWLERYPTVEGSVETEEQRWSQCVNWAIDSMMERVKVETRARI